ncbi:MAG: SDR family NAD(P)-dependent oxidoreductase [Anaerolineales bacterium]|nr:SDR family NAD(P)-dependent oxidoreductase [Anaerolineales bacterium]
MSRKICLVTGGNAGIGKAAAVQLAREGAEVFIACRNRERGEAALETIKIDSGSAAVSLVNMDLSSRESIIRGCKSIRSAGVRHIDALIHNAADFDVTRKQPRMSSDGVETVWSTNHLGPVLLTALLDPELSASEQGRVITVSSQGLMMHPQLQVNLEDPEFSRGGFTVERAYYQSKLAQVMYTFWLADRYSGTSKTANCIRVTNVKVDLDRYPDLSDFKKRLYALKSRFSISPEEMAKIYTWLAICPEVSGLSGKYFDEKRRTVGAGSWAENPGNIRKVMELTRRYVPELSAGGKQS